MNRILNPDDARWIEEHWSEKIVDDEYYLRQYPDVREKYKTAQEHFYSFGFYEGRNPSPWIDLDYCKCIANEEDRQFLELNDLFDLIGDLGSESLTGLSPAICPAWIFRQLNLKDLKFHSLLDMKVPEEGISLHPALEVCKAEYDGQTFHALFGSLERLDLSGLSLFDCTEYCSQHRDLRDFKNDPQRGFLHLWRYGIWENRLKYMGASVPEAAQFEELFRINMSIVVKTRLKSLSLDEGAKIKVFPVGGLRFSDFEASGIRKLVDYSSNSGADLPAISEIFAAREQVGDSCISICAEPEAQKSDYGKVSYPEEISDTDLFSGSYKVGSRRVVYSINLDGYDDLPTAPNLDDCTYFLISDKLAIPEDTPWIVVRPSVQEADNKRTCLWYKTHPHLLFPDAEYVVWIDSNIISQPGSGALLKAHESLSEVASFAHPDRDCVYEEANAVKSLGLDSFETIDRVLHQMKEDGMSAGKGLFETNVLFTRIRDLGVREFLDLWWQAISFGSRRDQMSFTYMAWKMGIEITQLDATNSAKTSRFFEKRSHLSNNGRFV